MCAIALFKRLSRTLQAFGQGSGGNTAIAFGLALLPVMGLTGAAVDYSRTNAVKAGMQTALDSTALMLAKEAAVDNDGQLQANAQKYFKAIFIRPDVNNISASALYTSGTQSQLKVNASASVPTAFMKIFGYNSITVSSSATAKWGNSRLRVALVLDNTGSMASDGKIGGAENRDQQSAVPAQECRRPQAATSMCRSFRS